MRKRITSALLTLVLLLSLIPAMGTTVLAADTESHPAAVNGFGNYDYMLGYYTDKFVNRAGSTYREVKQFTLNEISGGTPEAKWRTLTTKYADKGIGWIYYIPETGTLYIKGIIPEISFKAVTVDQDVLKVIVAGNATLEKSFSGMPLDGCRPGLKEMTIDFRNGSTLTLSI